MPVLPVYTSSRNIGTTPTAPMRNEAALPYQNQQKMIDTGMNVLQAIQKANDTMQYSKNKSEYEVGVLDIQTKASLDPDWNNLPKYQKQIADLKAKATQGINNGLLADQLTIEADHTAQIAGIKMAADFQGKQMKYDVNVVLPAEVDVAQKKMASAITDADFSMARDEMDKAIERRYTTGNISKDEMETYKKKMLYAAAESTLYTNTDTVRSQIEKGYYNELTAEQKTKLLSTANSLDEKALSDAISMNKQLQYKAETELVMDLASGKQINVMDVNKMAMQGFYDTDFTKAILDVMSLPAEDLATNITDPNEYGKYLKSIVESDDIETQRNAIVSILRGGKDGKLSKEDLEILLSFAVSRNKNGVETKPLDNATNTTMDWAKKVGMSVPKAVGHFLKAFAEGNDPYKSFIIAQGKTISEEIPEAAVLSSPPNIVLDRQSATNNFVYMNNSNLTPHFIVDPKKRAVFANPENVESKNGLPKKK